MSKLKFKICTIGPSGALELSPMTLSAEAAQRRNPAAFLELFEEMRRAAERVGMARQLELMKPMEKNGYLNNS